MNSELNSEIELDPNDQFALIKWYENSEWVPFRIHEINLPLYLAGVTEDNDIAKIIINGIYALNYNLYKKFRKNICIEKVNKIEVIIDKLRTEEIEESEFIRPYMLFAISVIWRFEKNKKKNKEILDKTRENIKQIKAIKEKLVKKIDKLVTHSLYDGIRCNKLLEHYTAQIEELRLSKKESLDDLIIRIEQITSIYIDRLKKNIDKNHLGKDEHLPNKFNYSTMSLLGSVINDLTRIIKISKSRIIKILCQVMIELEIYDEYHLEELRVELFKKKFGDDSKERIAEFYEINIDEEKEKELLSYLGKNLARSLRIHK